MRINSEKHQQFRSADWPSPFNYGTEKAELSQSKASEDVLELELRNKLNFVSLGPSICDRQ